MNKDCSHKFVGPNACAHCGATMEQVKAAGYDEALKLLHEQSAEIARLREERQELVERHGELVERALIAESDLAAERAAHEATKAEFAAWKDALESDALKAAEARVAELERGIGAINNEWHAETMRKLKAETAIDQARGLLLEAHHYHHRMPQDFVQRAAAWLRAHPEPATPAATGAEPWPMHMDCPSCGKEHVDELDPATGIDWSVRPHKTHLCLGCGHKWKPSAFHTVGVARAEKEQGT